MGIKRTTADKHFSKCVRLRTNYVCEESGLDFSHDIASIHCSHYISRGYKTTRFHPLNAFAHSYSSHDKLGGGRWGGGNLAEFSAHYNQIHGAEAQEFIRLLSKYPFPKFKRHEKSISDHYREIAKQMSEMRNDGITDRIEFDMYQGCEELNRLMEDIWTDVKSDAESR